jgi:hypothetical protein
MMLQLSIKICGIWHGIQQHIIKVKGKIITISKMSHKLRKNALHEQRYIELVHIPTLAKYNGCRVDKNNIYTIFGMVY